jgi:hypothetical protein
MIKKLLAALVGGTLFAIILPMSYWLIFDNMPLQGFLSGVILLAISGFVIGAILGIMFPKVFGFLFEMLFDI